MGQRRAAGAVHWPKGHQHHLLHLAPRGSGLQRPPGLNQKHDTPVSMQTSQRQLWPTLNVPERLRAALEGVLGSPVVYDDNWGLPGAQITFSHRVFAFPVFQVFLLIFQPLALP